MLAAPEAAAPAAAELAELPPQAQAHLSSAKMQRTGELPSSGLAPQADCCSHASWHRGSALGGGLAVAAWLAPHWALACLLRWGPTLVAGPWFALLQRLEHPEREQRLAGAGGAARGAAAVEAEAAAAPGAAALQSQRLQAARTHWKLASAPASALAPAPAASASAVAAVAAHAAVPGEGLQLLPRREVQRAAVGALALTPGSPPAWRRGPSRCHTPCDSQGTDYCSPASAGRSRTGRSGT